MKSQRVSDNSEPVFSIIVPAHNSGRYIRKCLSSITQQTYKRYELIVVCDACEDDTEAIAREYGAVIVTGDWHNDGLARSAGLDTAMGDWVLFLDDDDWWLHEYVLEQLVGKLREVGAKTDILCFSFVWRGVRYASPKSNAGGTSLYPAVWNKCWRRSFVGKTRFPNVTAISDWHFHRKMLAKNPRITIWDMPMYYYNYFGVPGSISEKAGQKIP